MMRAVVTGASGMLGAHVVKKLLEDGWDVISVIRPGSLRKRPWTADILRETEIIEADITQPVSPSIRCPSAYSRSDVWKNS